MARKTLQELNLIDNFLFNEMTMQEDQEKAEEFCRYLLETLLQRKFRNIRIHAQKMMQGMNMQGHGIQLDAYIEADDAEIIDIEPNRYSEDDERRSRFYHSVIDSKILSQGTKYKELKNVILIFIVPYDPFGENRMIYTIKNHCVESPQMCYNDGAATLFFYTKGELGCESEEIRTLLTYIENSCAENARGEELKNIHHMVDSIKCNGQIGVKYMSLSEEIWHETELAKKEAREEGLKEGREIGIKEGREEGLAEGLAEGIEKGRNFIIYQMLENGKSADQIAEFCGIELAIVRELEQQIVAE